MAGGTVLKWLKVGWESFLDPEKQQRVEALCDHLRRQISRQKRAFDLEAAVRGLEFDPDDLRLAREMAYRTYVARALDDAQLTDNERSSLEWVAQALRLTEKERSAIDRETGRRAFGEALALAVQDGHIDEAEASQFQSLAGWMRVPVSDVVSEFFAEEGEGFLRGMFFAAIEDGELVSDEWSRFLTSAGRLGFGRPEAIALVRPHAERFVERVLADAKADDRISRDEEANLAWLMNELAVSSNFRTYVRQEVGAVKQLADIRDGRLPALTHRIPVELRAGEIPHFYGPATFQRFRELKSGTKVDVHDGHVAITDSRLVFSSPDRPFILNLRKIISIVPEERYVDIQATSSTTGTFQFGEQTKLAGLILATAVGRANQTLVDRLAGLSDRHIPRDVRQRVWQRYGGRCAECGATDYLEFDHIIPIAKGGSNGEFNIQLLCRRCNLRKSDNI